jgi:ubiquitin
MSDKKDSKYGTFPRKWAKILDNLHEDDKFLEDVQQFSTSDLEKKIVDCNENMAEFKKNMELDADLKDAKEHVKSLAAVYKDGINVNEAKAMYCVYIKNSL